MLTRPNIVVSVLCAETVYGAGSFLGVGAEETLLTVDDDGGEFLCVHIPSRNRLW